MRKKDGGFAVAALLIGIAVAAVVYIAGFSSGRHASNGPAPGAERTAAASDVPPSQAAFTLAPQPASSTGDAARVAQHGTGHDD